MTGPEHYREAERLLEETGRELDVEIDAVPTFVAQLRAVMARAQVHATLALASATANPLASGWQDTEVTR